jgi:hypothetical protein
MKKIVFSLIMMFALALMAGSAMAQGKFAPLPGGTYSYTIDFAIANQSDATLTATGLTTGTSTISNVSPSLTDIAVGVTSVSFDVTYSNDATGTCTIDFVITDEVSSCSNTIYLDVPMNPIPTYTLTIAKNESGYDACQERTGAGDNTPDALGTDVGTEVNTFTFTVTPVVTGVTGNFDYSYTIDFPDGSALNSYTIVDGANNPVTDGVISYTGVGSVTTDVFTVTFNTTTGIITQQLTASLTVGATSTLDPVEGGSYDSTMASGGSLSESVDVNAVPTIGSFN